MHCVGPVLSAPDSSAPSPPGSLGSGYRSKFDWTNASWSILFLGLPRPERAAIEPTLRP